MDKMVELLQRYPQLECCREEIEKALALLLERQRGTAPRGFDRDFDL